MNLKLLILNTLVLIIHRTCAYQDHLFSELCPTSSLMKSFNHIIRNLPEVKLGEKEQSAALIHYSWNSSNFKKYDECKFKVVATLDDNKTRNRGLFVSIRRLNLRKSPNSEDCIDYIRFKFGDHKSPKFCGQLNASVDDVEKIYFGEGGGIIEVHLHLDKFRPLKYTEDTLDVDLVFTANEVSDCSSSDLIRCYENTCISKALENDGINNCPPPYCIDENGKCPKPPIVVTASETTSSHTDIVISALTSLIFTLVGVGSCLWLCWHVKDCFLPPSDSQSHTSTGGPDRRTSHTRATTFNSRDSGGTTLEMPAAPSSYDSGHPSAPPLDDKDDNPPPYDALFPKTNTNTNNK